MESGESERWKDLQPRGHRATGWDLILLAATRTFSLHTQDQLSYPAPLKCRRLIHQKA